MSRKSIEVDKIGCDIHGVVEIDWRGKYRDEGEEVDEEDRRWMTFIDNVGMWLGRSYDTFGMLFGVRNYANFDPIAAKRGLPENISDNLQEEVDYYDERGLLGGIDFHSASYITFDEIEEIEWDEEAENADSRVHVYDDDGNFLHKASYVGSLTDEERKRIEKGETVTKTMEHGDPLSGVEQGDKTHYKLEKITRQEALSGAWERLFDTLRDFAEVYGEENIRLVVWFDN